MITKAVNIKIVNVDEAPKYKEDTKMIKIVDVLVVKKGMENGLSSIDLQCVDADGNKYLVFTTAKTMKIIGSFCN